MNGYILKETFDTADKKATLIDVRLPDDLTNNVELNFGSIELKPKYQKQIKLKKNKMDDLQKMLPAIYPSGQWIPIFVLTVGVYDEVKDLATRSFSSRGHHPSPQIISRIQPHTNIAIRQQ